jgi:hypothetical protein
LTLMADLGGYLGLLLGYSLMDVSIFISFFWTKIKYVSHTGTIVSNLKKKSSFCLFTVNLVLEKPSF